MAARDLHFCTQAAVEWGEKNTLELRLKIPKTSSTAPVQTKQTQSKGRRTHARSFGHGLHIDVYGGGLPSIARMFLPLKQGQYLRVEGEELEGTEDSILLKLGTQTSPKRTTVLEQLKKLERSDKIFIVELLSQASGLNANSFSALAIRPSVLRGHLEGRLTGSVSAVTDAGNLPEDVAAALRWRPRERSLAGALLRWSLCPGMILAGGWLLLVQREAVLSRIPDFPGFSWVNSGPKMKQILPPVPQNMLEAFDIGVLCEQLRSVGRSEAAKTEVLTAAAAIVGQSVTAEEMEAIRAELVRVLGHRSIGQRVAGFFTFVNTMWLGAIGGITVSVGPVLWNLTKPLRRFFSQLAQKVKEGLVWLIEKVVLPTISRLHDWGFWEALAHGLAFLLTAQGSKVAEGPAVFVAISGLLASLGALHYSWKLHGQVVSNVLRKDYKFDMASITHLYLGLLFAPAAIQHHSQLLGFATIGNLLAALGFSAAVYPFCYCIGWESEDAMVRTAATSGLGVGVFCLARCCGVQPIFLEPFAPGVSVLGGLSHYLALLIRSNMWYRSRRSEQRYLWYNVSMLASLTVSQAAGRVYGLQGLANTSTTFFALWLLEKAAELTDVLNVSGWYLMFGGSVAAYYSALWLHANPSFVVSLLRALD
eukprot:TRINITY_DN84164_c0_g1_i1.p1 TRINITY_DN84164_c0_g1~~TRINITY_DN84164_c0_g1_i1.p1  ORF type:complete len:669 (+),score=132.52 TRINITY_DN84164_c0_g1_i1:64-2007(+)